MNYTAYLQHARRKYNWLDTATQDRLLKTYGTRTENILIGCNQMTDLGKRFTPTLYQVEIDYLLQEEWATSCEDILWRRTKMGLTITEPEVRGLSDYLRTHKHYQP